ncbi:glycoside hydrolase family 88 protein [Mucilaginibacter gossypii]|uniref:glycoside hydrolase family 88 protein n=1 Tax=Mucilaginibacter gossypii TaxID=551996 RepID=UPI000DCB6E02|nr:MULTISPECIES: glycoside hydrolase family 88 protein [Mucilaginibacter]QTE38083.1 glycoside hydrolase family 88 protein [Mucilaginibacter gossypii]RAV58598.1 glucuronyl hydrolase [Mucilaginibacter rubeus]
MKFKLLYKSAITACLLALSLNSFSQNSFKPQKDVLATIKKNFADAGIQYKYMAKQFGPEQFPKTYHPTTDKFETSNSSWWCSGFYSGTLLNLYQQTKDAELLNQANENLKGLEKEQYNKGTHDLGFMMYCSFGTANHLEPKPEYKEILINSAKSLSTRFNPTVGCIRSWNSKANDFLVIIDNMMNLELLFYATKATGDSSFYKIAVTHANTTMKNHFRQDFSSYHVINYDEQTGAVKEKKTAQGFANESAWARGQSWGLYGYTVMYRETKDKKYLEQAKNIAHFILTNPNLPADKIPYWDYNAPNIPNALRDASAASVMASALLELCRYVDKKDGQKYFNTAQTIIKNLSAPAYKADLNTNGGFILKHSVGHFPAGTEVDVPLTYADYYFVEAMQRYKAFAK